MKQTYLFLLCAILNLSLLAQEDNIEVPPKGIIQELKHSDVDLKNTFRINSKKIEFSPTYYQNGIVYVSADVSGQKIDANIGERFFELFYAELDGEGMPSNPQPFSAKVNSSTHEGPVTFNFNEDLIYFTRNSSAYNTKRKKTMKIFAAQRGNEDWENSQELNINGEEFHTMHPSLTANGQRLYFTSNRPNGYGGTDIYYIENIGKGWGEPINLGPTVNTNKNEAFPFIHESGMLFFASEGHGGKGGYDIYAVNVEDRIIAEILHLGTPFNTENADFGLVLNPTGTQGFFTSSRYGGIGQDDIYLFDAPNGLFAGATPVTSTANILVVSETENTPIADAGVYVFEKNKNGLFGEDDLYEVVLDAKNGNPDEMEVSFVMKKDLGKPDFYTNQEGLINTELPTNKEYLFLATKKGYGNKEVRYTTIGANSPGFVEIPLTTKSCATLSGVIRNGQTGSVIPNARIFIKSDCDASLQFVNTDATGRYEQCIPIGCDYILGAEKEGFAIGNTTVSTQNLTQLTLTKDWILSPIGTQLNISNNNLEEGATIVLENIYYDFNKSAIRAGAAEELDALVVLMQQYPSMEIELIAHTDARGDATYNQNLSKERALSAKDYLSRKGIAASRVKASGRGEDDIRNQCLDGVQCTDEEHQYNRRTEVRVTKLEENVGVRYSGK